MNAKSRWYFFSSEFFWRTTINSYVMTIVRNSFEKTISGKRKAKSFISVLKRSDSFMILRLLISTLQIYKSQFSSIINCAIEKVKLLMVFTVVAFCCSGELCTKINDVDIESTVNNLLVVSIMD